MMNARDLPNQKDKKSKYDFEKVQGRKLRDFDFVDDKVISTNTI
jgi:hypothetical protein